jgi:hypothetical protein
VAITEFKIAAAIAELDTVQRGARARLLEPSDVELAVDLYRAATAHARRLAVPGTGRGVVDGGAVAKSYGAQASTTRITVCNDGITVERAKARIVRGGDRGQARASIEQPIHPRYDYKRVPVRELGLPANARAYAGRVSW